MKKMMFLIAFLSCSGMNRIHAEELEPACGADQSACIKLACYKWSRFPNERLKLSIRRQGPLSEYPEEKRFRHARQTAFGAIGKEVGLCGGNTVAAVTGTIVTAVPGAHTVGPTGAHMSLIALSVRGRSGDSCRPVNFDCTTHEKSAVPKRWKCFSRNEFNNFHGASLLTLVDEAKDPRCSIFEDGHLQDVEQTEGTGSGLNSDS